MQLQPAGLYPRVLCPGWIGADDHAHAPTAVSAPHLWLYTWATLLHPKRLSPMAAGQVPRAAPGGANGQTCSLVGAAFGMTGTVEKVML